MIAATSFFAIIFAPSIPKFFIVALVVVANKATFSVAVLLYDKPLIMCPPPSNVPLKPVIGVHVPVNVISVVNT